MQTWNTFSNNGGAPTSWTVISAHSRVFRSWYSCQTCVDRQQGCVFSDVVHPELGSQTWQWMRPWTKSCLCRKTFVEENPTPCCRLISSSDHTSFTIKECLTAQQSFLLHYITILQSITFIFRVGYWYQKADIWCLYLLGSPKGGITQFWGRWLVIFLLTFLFLLL